MQNRGQIIFGVIILALGLTSLLSAVFNIDFWAFCWPIGLIVLGIWLMLRPRISRPDAGVIVTPFGDIHRRSAWTVSDQEIWYFIGDAEFDLSQATVPAGESTIRLYGFIGEIKIRAPRDLGVSVTSTAFLTDARFWGDKQDYFLTTAHRVNDAYASAESKVNIETMFFITNLRVEEV